MGRYNCYGRDNGGGKFADKCKTTECARMRLCIWAVCARVCLYPCELNNRARSSSTCNIIVYSAYEKPARNGFNARRVKHVSLFCTHTHTHTEPHLDARTCAVERFHRRGYRARGFCVCSSGAAGTVRSSNMTLSDLNFYDNDQGDDDDQKHFCARSASTQTHTQPYDTCARANTLE